MQQRQRQIDNVTQIDKRTNSFLANADARAVLGIRFPTLYR
ncbi:hypothetical protein HPTD01_134 [Halomonas sp. TD01]|nr:hypothetical protein HPTD01_134 [Halomonas sp. TD01]